ncbi:hypothetical protein KSK37_10455 [Kaistella sp. DKR-2]|uniref:hypothetical protein n=1 Tax=Kaistella soli TaxID=2849654 RepID=UPI001C262CD1|nr:hypothetical protein [Kaistella soli]MBU8883504.1 hypothetical protein [Kaistella soli]
MKTSDIYLILTEKELDKVRNIFNTYNKDFEQYKKEILKKGSSVNFNINKDKNFVFTKFHLSNLCNLFINDIIDELELNFIVDLIIASINSFENIEILEKLETLTDPEINGFITKEYASTMIL